MTSCWISRVRFALLSRVQDQLNLNNLKVWLTYEVLYKERRESKYDIIPIAQGPATKLDLKSKYLLEERDSILKERLKLLEKYEKIKKFTGYGNNSDRPNLLRNSGINVLDNSAFTLQIKDPRGIVAALKISRARVKARECE